MAITVMKTLLVSMCLLNMNLFCGQAASWKQPQGQQMGQPMGQSQGQKEENKKPEADYTVEITEAKVSSFNPVYFSKKTTLYTTMYNESFTVVNGVLDMVKPLPPDVQLKVDLFEFDPTSNMYIQKASPVPYVPICDFIENNPMAMKIIYKFTDLKDKKCPIFPAPIAIKNAYVNTDDLPNHIPETRFRANTEYKLKNTQETILSLVLYGEVLTKPGMED